MGDGHSARFSLPRARTPSQSRFASTQFSLAHTRDKLLKENIPNARAKLSKDEDSKKRIIKRAPGRKIDLAVAASMAVHQVLYLDL